MKHITIITPSKSWKNLLKEWWDYREVLLLLGWKDIILQYRQTVVGVLWVVLRPLLTVAVFTIVFNKIAGLSSGDKPYVLVVFSGMLVWQFFADAFSYGSGSFLANVSLISKVYFPRIMLPASRMLCSTIDFAISFLFYQLVAVIKYGSLPTINLFLLPLFFIWLCTISLSASLFFGSLVVTYRDFKHVIPFAIQLGLYCTPVAFSFSMIPQKYYLLLSLNPLSGVINGFRYCLLGEYLYYPGLMVSGVVTLLLVLVSAFYFKKAERLFADVI